MRTSATPARAISPAATTRWRITIATGAGQGSRRRRIDRGRRCRRLVRRRDRCGASRRWRRRRRRRGRRRGWRRVGGVVGGVVGGIVWLFSVHLTMASNGMVPMLNGKASITTSRSVPVAESMLHVPPVNTNPAWATSSMVISTLPPGTGSASEPTTQSNVAVPAPAVGSVRLAGGVAGSDGKRQSNPGAPVTLVIVAVTSQPLAG